MYLNFYVSYDGFQVAGEWRWFGEEKMVDSLKKIQYNDFRKGHLFGEDFTIMKGG